VLVHHRRHHDGAARQIAGARGLRSVEEARHKTERKMKTNNKKMRSQGCRRKESETNVRPGGPARYS
jgi:hypothetical protein